MTGTTVPAVTGPGVYADLDEATYHADPALSSSGARKLLPPSCPALFKHDRDHGQQPRRVFDFGHAAHAQVLGVGAPVVIVQRTARDGTKSSAEDYRAVSAQAHRGEILAQGFTPLLAAEAVQVVCMSAAIRAHPLASALLQPGRGTAEQSLFWWDDTYGVNRRARLDWMTGRVIVDYKTTTCADVAAVAKSMHAYGYHCQAAWYREAAIRLELADDPRFVLIFQEKIAPYLVTVAEPDIEALRVGRLRNEQAMKIFASCTATGVWPGYSTDVELISLPPWAIRDIEDTQ